MSRARNIKPAFFKNDRLGECSPLARLLFAGLWCEADREGRLEDRPKRLKAEILPYDDCDIASLLGELESGDFITRYRVGVVAYIAIKTFAKHQNPHVREPASTIPAPQDADSKQEPEEQEEAPDKPGASPVPAQGQHRTGPADSPFLIPDSLQEQKQARSPTGSRLPPDWQAPEEWLAWAYAERPELDALAEAAKFADYWHGVAGAKGRKADWAATWRNWIRNSNATPKARAGPAVSFPTQSKTLSAIQTLQELKNGLATSGDSGRTQPLALLEPGSITRD